MIESLHMVSISAVCDPFLPQKICSKCGIFGKSKFGLVHLPFTASSGLNQKLRPTLAALALLLRRFQSKRNSRFFVVPASSTAAAAGLSVCHCLSFHSLLSSASFALQQVLAVAVNSRWLMLPVLNWCQIDFSVPHPSSGYPLTNHSARRRWCWSLM